ncbi:hypothetical protein R3P38DRAFT_1057812 [Favolaschia claudopus]|uniref:Uncharacterized protein n=1 Tax=Favolaschia claudopus TaxID=2862362 RepID=A0AAW0BI81_9AGAR
MPKSPSQMYHRLVCKKHGIPQFTPEPSQNLPAEYRMIGVSIGDVGVWHDGSFDVLFNTCRLATNSLNRAHGVPKHFPVFPLHSYDVSRRPYHSAGSIIASAKMSVVSLDMGASSIISPFVPTSLGSSITFKFGSAEGAILVLPDGASRQNLLPVESFRAHVRDSSTEWYRYARNWLSASDSLFVVTGCDKTASWAIATASATTGTIGFSLKLSVVGMAEATLGPRYQWMDFGSATVRTSSPCDTLSGNENQCIFIRGFFVPRSTPFVDFIAHRIFCRGWRRFLAQRETDIEQSRFKSEAEMASLRAVYRAFGSERL